jgi:hypothetical protein
MCETLQFQCARLPPFCRFRESLSSVCRAPIEAFLGLIAILTQIVANEFADIFAQRGVTGRQSMFVDAVQQCFRQRKAYDFS